MNRYHYEARMDDGRRLKFDTVSDSEPEAHTAAFEYFRGAGVTDDNATAVDFLRVSRAYLGDE